MPIFSEVDVQSTESISSMLIKEALDAVRISLGNSCKDTEHQTVTPNTSHQYASQKE